MDDKLRDRVEALFEEAPQTKKASELKEELISNLTEKYNDLVANGRTSEEAYNSVIAGIGDIDELIRGLKHSSPFDQEKELISRKKTALVVSASVGLYIFSVIVLIVCTELLRLDDILSIVLFLFTITIPTCLLIYHFMAQPSYKKEEDTLVEEFKEWNQNSKYKKELYQSINSIMWTLVTVIYLLVSFIFGIWAFSWIIFIIGAVLQQIIHLIFSLSNRKE
ncbi:hypothetical protein CS063_07975 [Sporanaerobium hydrogeniformans]|uniref:Uncharacterized protein n=1 Tax=Sporanaerobium hydrogeniformans TaxID=3072179 RepID=A0AC61DDT3_9FIRM|nr:permease prefix domain 1-containing protein [Sporanaerobium hydrogeniformans]PHV70948.1 hypothetical protein CS063_07975 [Sporanaerobium hydrogeniformans]